LIPGYFDPSSPALPLPRLRVAVLIPSLPGVEVPTLFAVEFLIDTGASVTCLHPFDAIQQARIPMSTLSSADEWPNRQRHGGITGQAMYFPTPCRYAFLQHDGTFVEREGEIAIAQLTTTNAGVPSLLGWDILQHYKLTADWASRTLTLE